MRRPDILLCAAASLLLAPTLAHSADNCQMRISEANVDYGATTRAELLKKQVSPLMMGLGKRNVTLTATCKTPTLMTLFFRGSGADGNAYRLGGGGSFTLRALNARIDGRSVGLGSVVTAGMVPEQKADSLPLPPNRGVVPIQNDVPVKGVSLQIQVEISALVSSTGSRIADRTVFSGAGNFELQEN
ncbi:DUF1120 domain-containing protein [Herbaspirillum sp. LeCh32-8]|uniref:DUF1120 domain-containing protein n=1 Tax=Herbaspirillum sp. LeCh32-8 TaxID=2821356 RepID=UPI001AE18AA4|nr:DUF1120 domain-containing protein [Herbaspirillum sp. LeCh32-8]MBP0596590.1 DUF1120 domain-containing protein [Herbaspirillum sp. LeCh32-8]